MRVNGSWAQLCPHGVGSDPVLQRLRAVLAEPSVRQALEHCERQRLYPADVLRRLHEAGLADVLCGSRTTAHHLCGLNLETAYSSASLGITVGVTALALLPVLISGSEAQQERAAAHIRSGGSLSLLLTEEAHGSDILHNQASARQDRDGHFHLTGDKHLINGGSTHDLLVCMLRTRSRPEGSETLAAVGDFTLFLVPRSAQVQTQRRHNVVCPAADISDVRLQGVVVAQEAVLGGVGEGAGILQRALTVSRGGISGLSAGLVSRAREIALGYARSRTLYGAPIAQLGAIGGHLARLCALDAIVAAIAVKQAAAVNAMGTQAAHVTAVAKYAGAVLAERAVEEGRRVLGARALVEGQGYDGLVRDVPLFAVFDGTTHVMLEQIQWKMAQAAARPDDGSACLDKAALALATPPRLLREALRAPVPSGVPDLCAHLRALCPNSPLGTVAQALMQATRALRASGRWQADQELRLSAAATWAELEALVALIELADPGAREVLGLGPPPDDFPAELVPFATGWLGAQLAAAATHLTLRAGLPRGPLPEAEQALVALMETIHA